MALVYEKTTNMTTETPKNGLHTYYWYNFEGRQKEAEGHFKDGKEDGKWTWWWEDGQKQKEINYKNL